jgi:hypothetical protein
VRSIRANGGYKTQNDHKGAKIAGMITDTITGKALQGSSGDAATNLYNKYYGAEKGYHTPGNRFNDQLSDLNQPNQGQGNQPQQPQPAAPNRQDPNAQAANTAPATNAAAGVQQGQPYAQAQAMGGNTFQQFKLRGVNGFKRGGSIPKVTQSMSNREPIAEVEGGEVAVLPHKNKYGQKVVKFKGPKHDPNPNKPGGIQLGEDILPVGSKVFSEYRKVNGNTSYADIAERLAKRGDYRGLERLFAAQEATNTNRSGNYFKPGGAVAPRYDDNGDIIVTENGKERRIVMGSPEWANAGGAFQITSNESKEHAAKRRKAEDEERRINSLSDRERIYYERHKGDREITKAMSEISGAGALARVVGLDKSEKPSG